MVDFSKETRIRGGAKHLFSVWYCLEFNLSKRKKNFILLRLKNLDEKDRVLVHMKKAIRKSGLIIKPYIFQEREIHQVD